MKEFKKPDLKAPRFRPEVKSVLDREFFKLFKKKFSKYKSMDDALIKTVIKRFNQTLYQTVIETRDGVQLPEQIGWLFIGTCQKSKKENVDFSKSLKYGVKVINKNWDSDGKLAKIFFSNYAPKHRIKNREFWSFVACRDFKRAVAKTYPENWTIYIQVDPKIKLQWVYGRTIGKDRRLKEMNKALENYNEFDL